MTVESEQVKKTGGQFANIKRSFELLADKNAHKTRATTILGTDSKKIASKVSVTFGKNMKIVVPVTCSMLVSDLMSEAEIRFRKLVETDAYNGGGAFNCEKAARVKYLRSAANGGILYSSDRLTHVVDDNEQLIAVLDDENLAFNASNVQIAADPSYQAPVGSGRFVSEVHSSRISEHSATKNQFYDEISTKKQISSEISNVGNVCSIRIKNSPSLEPPEPNTQSMACHAVEVKNLDDIPASTSSLIVRRGSEPTFNGPDASAKSHNKSALKMACAQDPHNALDPYNTSPSKTGVKWQDEQSLDKLRSFESDKMSSASPSNHFKRDGARKSRVTDEMLEFAAQLAENARFNTDSNQVYTGASKSAQNDPGLCQSHNMALVTSSSSPSSASGSARTQAPRMSELQRGNTRRLGKLISLELTKSEDGGGLGFTVTSRDNATTDDDFTCIRNILPRGAAVRDGRLKEGDRLLKINDKDVSDLSKDKIVRMLRSIEEGRSVKLVVSRQVELNGEITSPMPRRVPRESIDASDDTLGVPSWEFSRQKQRLTFDVPLNDSGSAGLGVSVKGRTRRAKSGRGVDDRGAESNEDSCGIFVKLIIHGGAAFKDGRLKVNDQLVAVDNVDLTGFSNKDAMNALRRVMQKLDPSTSIIRLAISRDVNAGGKLGPFPPPSTPDGAASLLLETPRSAAVDAPSFDKIQPFNVPGFGDYALVVKGVNGFAPTSSQGQRSDDRFLIEDDRYAPSDDKLKRRSSVPTEISENQSEPSNAEESEFKMDPFVRESRGRQSMSEKRRGAFKLDPTQTATYMQILHQRQSSAPSLVSVKKSPALECHRPCVSDKNAGGVASIFHDGASTFGAAERRTLSLESVSVVGVQPPSSALSRHVDFDAALSPSTAQFQNVGSMTSSTGRNSTNKGGKMTSSVTVMMSASPRQRNGDFNAKPSVVAITRDKIAQKPLLHEQIARNIATTSTRASMATRRVPLMPSGVSSVNRRQQRHTYYDTSSPFKGGEASVAEFCVGMDHMLSGKNQLNSPTENPPGPGYSAPSPHHTLATQTGKKKSSGSGSLTTLKNLFRFGSAGKSSKKFSISPIQRDDSSERRRQTMNPETMEVYRLRAQEEQRRIRLYYERLREQQRRVVCPVGPDNPRRRGGQPVPSASPLYAADARLVLPSPPLASRRFDPAGAPAMAQGFASHTRPVPFSRGGGGNDDVAATYEMDYYKAMQNYELAAAHFYGPNNSLYRSFERACPPGYQRPETLGLNSTVRPQFAAEPSPDYPITDDLTDVISNTHFTSGGDDFLRKNPAGVSLSHAPLVTSFDPPPLPLIPPPDYDEYLRSTAAGHFYKPSPSRSGGCSGNHSHTTAGNTVNSPGDYSRTSCTVSHEPAACSRRRFRPASEFVTTEKLADHRTTNFRQSDDQRNDYSNDRFRPFCDKPVKYSNPKLGEEFYDSEGVTKIHF